jgi:protein phosphatase 2C family protein 2/3
MMVMEVWKHSITRLLVLSKPNTGGSVARFAGQNVHRRLLQDDSYQQQNYEEAMRRAFLGTDEDMLAGD